MGTLDRLEEWLAKRSLKLPAQHDPARFTQDVMGRVRAEAPAASAASARRWGWWPQVGLAAAAAAALLVVRVNDTSGSRLAASVERQIQLLAALNEPSLLDPSGLYENGLAREAEELDAFMLAEAQPADDAWIEQTVELLNQLDEDAPEDASGEPSGDGWLQELESLDASEFSAQS